VEDGVAGNVDFSQTPAIAHKQSSIGQNEEIKDKFRLNWGREKREATLHINQFFEMQGMVKIREQLRERTREKERDSSPERILPRNSL